MIFKNPVKIKFSVSLATLVILLVIGLSGATLLIVQHESTAASIDMTERLFTEIGAKLLAKGSAVYDRTAALAETASIHTSLPVEPTGNGMGHPALPWLMQALDSNEHLLALHCTYGGGAYLQVIATKGKVAQNVAFEAPIKTYKIIHAITKGSGAIWQEHWTYLSATGDIVKSYSSTSTSSDPRDLPHYSQAIKDRTTLFFTEPYVLKYGNIPGITCVCAMEHGNGVFGVDIALSHFTQFFWDQQVSDHGSAFLFDHKSRLLAHPNELAVAVIRKGTQSSLWYVDMENSQNAEVRAVAELWDSYRGINPWTLLFFEINGQKSMVQFERFGSRWGGEQIAAIVAPVTDFTGHIRKMQRRTFLLSGFVLFIAVFFALLLSFRVSQALTRLAGEAEKVQQLDFTDSPKQDSIIREIYTLIHSFTLMKTTIRERTESLYATQRKLETLVDRGISLSSEKDINRLLELIFHSAIELTRAKHAVLYRMDEKQHILYPVFLHKNGLSSAVCVDGEPVEIAPIQFKEAGSCGAVSIHEYLFNITEQHQPIRISSFTPYEYEWFPRGLLEEGSRCTLLSVPMNTSQGKSKGLLLLFEDPLVEGAQQELFGEREIEFAKALAAQAAAALENRDLLASLQELMDAVLKVMAGAIDAKSPHTGNHCARVPVVARLLAEVADDCRDGPLADFSFQSEDEWRTFEVAAWLHDCGKLTIPERVVGKATKLEILTNRIHEIRTRFEVLLRDSEITLLRQQIDLQHVEKNISKLLEQERQKLTDDFAFVARCNLNSEVLSQSQQERLKVIGSRTFKTYFDEKLGLSAEELKKLPSDTPLPGTGLLLVDNPEHLVFRSEEELRRLSTHNFVMPVPQYKYNYGELYNLSVPKGTLTVEERFIIQEHIIQTIFMLDTLPFPPSLSNISEFATNHHERIDGKGYPRGLKGSEMSLPARMMAIADVFEALSSWDRPYKKAKPLSEVLLIMKQMCEEGHLDRDLFNLLLESDVCRKYGEDYLIQEQMDVNNPLEYRVKNS